MKRGFRVTLFLSSIDGAVDVITEDVHIERAVSSAMVQARAMITALRRKW